MGEDSVRVLTLDDHKQFLDVIHDVVDATPGFESVGELSSPEEALRTVEETEPEMVLVDVYMPEMSGIEVVSRIKAHHESTVAILISSHEPSEIPSSAYTCGAAAVVCKQDLGPGMIRKLWDTHGPAPSGHS